MLRLLFMIMLPPLLTSSAFLKNESISSSSTTTMTSNRNLLLHNDRFALLGFLGAPGQLTTLGILNEGDFGVLHSFGRRELMFGDWFSWKSFGVWRSLAMVKLRERKKREKVKV